MKRYTKTFQINFNEKKTVDGNLIYSEEVIQKIISSIKENQENRINIGEFYDSKKWDCELPCINLLKVTHFYNFVSFENNILVVEIESIHPHDPSMGIPPITFNIILAVDHERLDLSIRCMGTRIDGVFNSKDFRFISLDVVYVEKIREKLYEEAEIDMRDSITSEIDKLILEEIRTGIKSPYLIPFTYSK